MTQDTNSNPIESAAQAYLIRTNLFAMDFGIPTSTQGRTVTMTPPIPMSLELPTTPVLDARKLRSPTAKATDPTTVGSSPRGAKHQFVCDICGQTLSREHDIHRHKQTKHNTDGGLQYHCLYIGLDNCSHIRPFRKDKLKDHYEAKHRGRDVPVITPGNPATEDDQTTDAKEVGNHGNIPSTLPLDHVDSRSGVAGPMDHQLPTYPFGTFGIGAAPEPQQAIGTLDSHQLASEPTNVYNKLGPHTTLSRAQPEYINPEVTLRGSIISDGWASQGDANPGHAVSNQAGVEAIRGTVSHNIPSYGLVGAYNRVTNSQFQPHEQAIPLRQHLSNVPPPGQRDDQFLLVSTQSDQRQRSMPSHQHVLGVPSPGVDLRQSHQAFYGQGDNVTVAGRNARQQDLGQRQQEHQANRSRRPSIAQSPPLQLNQAQNNSARSSVFHQQASAEFQQANTYMVSHQPGEQAHVESRPHYTLQQRRRSDQPPQVGHPFTRQQSNNYGNHGYPSAPHPRHGQ